MENFSFDPERAEEILQSIYPNMITSQQLAEYNDHRFDNGNMLPAAKLELNEWTDRNTYIERVFYIDVGEEWIPKLALYGVWEGMGDEPCLVVEDI